MTDSNKTGAYLIRNASTVSICRAGGVVSGFFLDALILARFGVGSATDAFFAALAIPFLIGSILNTQSAYVLVPVFSNLLTDKESKPEETSYLLGAFVTSTIAVLFAVSLAGTAAASFLVPLQVPGLEAETVQLAVRLSRILFWMILFWGVSAILASLLLSFDRYLLPALGKLLSNTVVIVIMLLLSGSIGIKAVALGYLGGTLLPIALMSWAVASEGLRFRLVFNPLDPKVREMFKLFVYPFAGQGVNASRTLVENFLASFLGTGSLSVLRYASRIVQTIAAVLVGGAIIPTLRLVSRAAAEKDLEQMKASLSKSVKLVCFLGLPLAAWLAFTGEEWIVLLFERGEFTRESAALTGTVIALMAPFILTSRLNSIFQVPFYATLDMRTPMFASVISFSSYTALALSLRDSLGLYAFPVSMTLSSLITVTFIYLMFRRRFGKLGWERLGSFQLRLTAATALAVIGFVAGFRLLGYVPTEGLMGKVLALAIPSVCGGIVFAVGVVLLRVVNFRLRSLWAT